MWLANGTGESWSPGGGPPHVLLSPGIFVEEPVPALGLAMRQCLVPVWHLAHEGQPAEAPYIMQEVPRGAKCACCPRGPRSEPAISSHADDLSPRGSSWSQI